MYIYIYIHVIEYARKRVSARHACNTDLFCGVMCPGRGIRRDGAQPLICCRTRVRTLFRVRRHVRYDGHARAVSPRPSVRPGSGCASRPRRLSDVGGLLRSGGVVGLPCVAARRSGTRRRRTCCWNGNTGGDGGRAVCSEVRTRAPDENGFSRTRVCAACVRRRDLAGLADG
jgi:hypothetical protein